MLKTLVHPLLVFFTWIALGVAADFLFEIPRQLPELVLGFSGPTKMLTTNVDQSGNSACSDLFKGHAPRGVIRGTTLITYSLSRAMVAYFGICIPHI